MILQELLDELGGNLAQGDVEWIVDAVSAYETASAFDLAFAESEAAVAAALKSNAGTIVLKQGMATEYPKGKCIIETEQPKLWFAKAAKLVRKPPLSLGIAPGAVVAPDAKVDPAVFVGSNAVVGSHAWIGAGSRIGAGAIVGEFVKIGIECTIYPRVVIYPGVTLGDRVVVHAGAVLGADGFGYVRDTETGAYTHFPQQGKLVIEDDVEIGANSTIDRGALKETRIRKGTKMDNLVHVGHNCEVGPDAILVALTGISGSSTIGKGAVLAGQVGIGDHVHVGEGVILGGQSGVFNGKTITNEGHKPGTVMFGTPARPLKQVLREQATLSRLAKSRERGDKGTADKDRE
ncbi:MAG TPA: UDP-3-O-(3-hydroxymyristoyl)glucosamine N-acyltransferase [Terracidiphilus sp.]|nr:UDP-3-O-(3-hydroxymyristoyl)glucosamine N-acyltransferase [Terracidiphilus sp.]